MSPVAHKRFRILEFSYTIVSFTYRCLSCNTQKVYLITSYIIRYHYFSRWSKAEYEPVIPQSAQDPRKARQRNLKCLARNTRLAKETLLSCVRICVLDWFQGLSSNRSFDERVVLLCFIQAADCLGPRAILRVTSNRYLRTSNQASYSVAYSEESRSTSEKDVSVLLTPKRYYMPLTFLQGVFKRAREFGNITEENSERIYKLCIARVLSIQQETFAFVDERECRVISRQDVTSIMLFNAEFDCFGFLNIPRHIKDRGSRTLVLPLKQEERTSPMPPKCDVTGYYRCVSLSLNDCGIRQQHVWCKVSKYSFLRKETSFKQDRYLSLSTDMDDAGNFVKRIPQASQESKKTESPTERLACGFALIDGEHPRIFANSKISSISHDTISDDEKSRRHAPIVSLLSTVPGQMCQQDLSRFEQREDTNNFVELGNEYEVLFGGNSSGLCINQKNVNSGIVGQELHDSNAHVSHERFKLKDFERGFDNVDSKFQINCNSHDKDKDHVSVDDIHSENVSMYDNESSDVSMYESESDCGSDYETESERERERVGNIDPEQVQQYEQHNFPNGNDDMAEYPAIMVPLVHAIPQLVQAHAWPNAPVNVQGNQPGPQNVAIAAQLVDEAQHVGYNPQALQLNPVPQDEAAEQGVSQQLPHAPGHNLALFGPHDDLANEEPQDEAPMGANLLYHPLPPVEDEIEAANGDGEVPGAVVGNEVALLANNDVGIDEAPPFGEVVPAPQAPPQQPQGQNLPNGQNPQQGYHPQHGNQPPQQPNTSGPLRRLAAAVRYVKRKLRRSHNALPMYVLGAPREERLPAGLEEAPPLIGVPHPEIDEETQPTSFCGCFAFLFRHHEHPAQGYPSQNEQREEFEEQIALIGLDNQGMEEENDEHDIAAVEQPVGVPDEQIEAVAPLVEVI